jgi:gas vesicle protein
MARPQTNAGFVTGMVVGAAAGAALALLYTPRSGRKALALLKRRGADASQGDPRRQETEGMRAGRASQPGFNGPANQAQTARDDVASGAN